MERDLGETGWGLLFLEKRQQKIFGAKMVVAFGVAESLGGDGLYGSPPGRSFCAYKRNQNTLGAAPQDPDASEPPRPERLRLPGELGPPAGRKARWGKEDAPQRGGLPEA